MKRNPTGSELVGIVLSGLVEGEKIAVCEHFDVQVQKTLGKYKENPIIKKTNIYFTTRGAFPYSHEVWKGVSILYESGFLERMGEGEVMILPVVGSFGKEEYTKEHNLSEEKIEFLRGIGKEIKLKARYENAG